MSVGQVLLEHGHTHLSIEHDCVCTANAHLGSCSGDGLACKASNMYTLDFYRTSLLIQDLPLPGQVKGQCRSAGYGRDCSDLESEHPAQPRPADCSHVGRAASMAALAKFSGQDSICNFCIFFFN